MVSPEKNSITSDVWHTLNLNSGLYTIIQTNHKYLHHNFFGDKSNFQQSEFTGWIPLNMDKWVFIGFN